jgi:hypothetical protein
MKSFPTAREFGSSRRAGLSKLTGEECREAAASGLRHRAEVSNQAYSVVQRLHHLMRPWCIDTL